MTQALQTLKDVRCPVCRFMFESRKCAREQFGFAALLTIFPVIFGVSEAIVVADDKDDGISDPMELRKRAANRRLLSHFVSAMGDSALWLVLPESVAPSERVVVDKLTDIRDSLAHQFSLPNDVVMVNTLEDGRAQSEERPDTWFVSTIDFANAVEETAYKIIASNPDVPFDPLAASRGQARGAANRFETPPDSAAQKTSPTSGSGVGGVNLGGSVSSQSTQE